MIGLKLLWQDYWLNARSSDSRLVSLTQLLLSFFLLTLTLTGASIQHYLDDNLENMLGSDLVLEQYKKGRSANEARAAVRQVMKEGDTEDKPGRQE